MRLKFGNKIYNARIKTCISHQNLYFQQANIRKILTSDLQRLEAPSNKLET